MVSLVGGAGEQYWMSDAFRDPPEIASRLDAFPHLLPYWPLDFILEGRALSACEINRYLGAKGSPMKVVMKFRTRGKGCVPLRVFGAFILLYNPSPT